MISKLRTGVGVDAHQFGETGPCALAGLQWPDAPRLVGHSDGDAAVHALCDAVLSACQLGDVGTFFGVDTPEMAGASGVAMIEKLRDFVTAKGFVINNVALQIVGINQRSHHVAMKHKRFYLQPLVHQYQLLQQLLIRWDLPAEVKESM